MAKQSGLHQIRGKVGEHSYYRQTGVSSGLIRSINQGMSQRVKTGDEFVNTRLNNAEFGQACRIAGVLGQYITPKYRPMILPFSQSKMAKQIIGVIKAKSGTWGQRNLVATDNEVLVSALNSVAKNNASDWGISVVTDQEGVTITSDDTLFPSKLAAIGADGVDVIVIAASPWIGTFEVSENRYANSYLRGNKYYGRLRAASGSFNVDFEFRPNPPQGWPAIQIEFGIVIILPYREVNEVKYTLQEHCTFFAFEEPEQV